jgi:hypothetical protein
MDNNLWIICLFSILVGVIFGLISKNSDIGLVVWVCFFSYGSLFYFIRKHEMEEHE